MREKQRAHQPCAAKRGFAALSTGVLAVGLTMSQAPAAYAAPEETDDSGALATAVDADLLGLDLADIGYVSSGFPSDPGPNHAPINVEALSAVELSLGEINLPILGEDGLLPADELGVLYGFAHSPNPYTSTAATGAVNSEGAIDLGSGEGYGDATIDLQRALAEGLGLDLTGVIDDIRVDLGALSSRAHQGPGGEIETDYTIAGADLVINSPLVAGLSGTLNETVGELDGTLSALLGTGGAVDGALTDLSGAISDLPVGDDDLLGGLLALNLQDPTLAVDLDLQAITDEVLAESLVSESGITTIDLSTGEIHVDLEMLSGGNLNGRPANTQILSAAELELITGEITGLLGEAVGSVTSAVEQAVLTSEATIDLGLDLSALSGIGGGLSVDVEAYATLTVGQLLGVDDTPLNEDNITFEGTGISLPLLPDIPLGDVADFLVQPLLTEVLPQITGPVLNDVVLEAGGITGPLDTVLSETLGALDPVFDALPGVLELTVNEQRTSTAIGEDTFTISALSATVLPSLGEGAVALPLATSNIRVDEFDPAIESTPLEVEVGEEVTTDGTGWPSTSTVVVEYIDSTGESVGIQEGIEVDENGEFVDIWEVPEGTALGELTIVATDESVADISVTDTVTVIEDDGTEDGTEDGTDDGTDDGVEDGDVDGVEDGTEDGTDDGDVDGTDDGTDDGVEDGAEDGTDDGAVDGTEDGDVDGAVDGTEDGVEDGTDDGDVDGTDDGDVDGTDDGVEDGAEDGTDDGAVDGTEDGADDGDVDGTEQAGTEDGTDDGTQDGGTDDGADDGTEDSSITIDPDTAAPGESVTVEGEGFAPGSEVTVVVTDEDGNVIDTIEGIETDAEGGFSYEWTIPEGTDPGELTVTAEDVEGNSASGIVTVTDEDDVDDGADDGTEDSSITIDPDTAAPGESVTVEGEGYAPDSGITIEVTDEDGNVIDLIEGIETDAEGGFSYEWTIPEGTDPGELTVTAEDVEGNSASGIVTVTDADGVGTADGTEAGAAGVSGDQPRDGLAVTGTTVLMVAALGALAVALGAGILFYNRRRALSSE